jgi:hypothetical protein
MTHLSAPPPSISLQEVQLQFESWRKNPDRARRIPEELWDAAARLCLEHSVHSVSRTLRLNYNDLKERLKHTADLPVRATFAELGIITASTEVVVDCDDGSGRRMRIHCKGAKAEAVVPDLLKSFWGTRR